MASWAWTEPPAARSARRPLHFVLLLATMTLAVTGLAGHHPLADVAAPLLVQLVGLSLAAAAALVRPAGRCTTFAVGIILTAALPPFVAHLHLTAPKSAIAPRPDALRVFLVNTWHAHPDHDALARHLAESGADVLVLTEFGPDKRAVLSRLEAAYPFRASCAESWHCAVAILSRRPISSADARRAGAESPPIVRAVIDVAGEPVTLVATHLHRPTRNPWRHRRHLDALQARLEAIRGHVIVAGDLNTSPWAPGLARMMQRTRLLHANVFLPTWPAAPLALPQVALDHVLVSPGLTFAAATLARKLGSDHLPLMVEIVVRAKTGATAPTPGLDGERP